MMLYRVRSALTVLFLSLLIVISGAQFASAEKSGDVKWKNKKFGVAVSDETLFNVFEMIGAESGIGIQPADNLKKTTVTRDLSSFSLEGAFAYLLKEYLLDYEYDEAGNYIRVFKKDMQKPTTWFFRLGEIKPAWFEKKLDKYGFWKKEYVIDKDIGLLIAKDTGENIETLKEYIDELVKTQGWLDADPELQKAIDLGSSAKSIIGTAKIEIISTRKKIEGLRSPFKKPSAPMQNFNKRMKRYEMAVNEIDKGKKEVENLHTKINLLSQEAEGLYSDLSKESNLHTAMVKAKEIEAKMELAVDYVESASRTWNDLNNKFVRRQVIKFIPLRYAAVGGRTINFMGQEIEVPGIDETLKELLGLDEDRKPVVEENGVMGLRAKITKISASLDRANDEKRKARKKEGKEQAMSTWTPEPGKILFDASRNAVIVKDYPENIKEIEEIIQELDREVPLIQLEAVILNASKNFARSLGFRYSGLMSGSHKGDKWQAQGNQGGSVAIPDNMLTAFDPSTQTNETSGGSTVVTTPSRTSDQVTSLPTLFSPIAGLAGSSGASLFFTGSKLLLNVQISAAEQAGLARVLSNPRVVTFDNQEALIQAGQTVNVKVPGGGYEAGSTIKSISTGVALRVNPHIVYAKDEYGEIDYSKVDGIMMQIQAQNSSFNASSVDGIPGTDTQNITTQVMVADNTTIVLGGLYSLSDSDTEDGIPFLKDIPILGALFRGKSKNENKSELLFFITPKVISNKIATATAYNFNPAIKNSEFILKSIANADRLLNNASTIELSTDSIKKAKDALERTKGAAE